MANPEYQPSSSKENLATIEKLTKAHTKAFQDLDTKNLPTGELSQDYAPSILSKSYLESLSHKGILTKDLRNSEGFSGQFETKNEDFPVADVDISDKYLIIEKYNPGAGILGMSGNFGIRQVYRYNILKKELVTGYKIDSGLSAGDNIDGSYEKPDLTKIQKQIKNIPSDQISETNRQNLLRKFEAVFKAYSLPQDQKEQAFSDAMDEIFKSEDLIETRTIVTDPKRELEIIGNIDTRLQQAIDETTARKKIEGEKKKIEETTQDGFSGLKNTINNQAA